MEIENEKDNVYNFSDIFFGTFGTFSYHDSATNRTLSCTSFLTTIDCHDSATNRTISCTHFLTTIDCHD